MTRPEFAMGSLTFIAVAAAGLLSAAYVDRHFAMAEARKEQASSSKPETPSPSSGACVDADGSWKNWPWPNVPMLSPKCRPDR
jgi:hypothetical protein